MAIKERYLKTNESVSTEQLYQSSTKTPGEARIIDRDAWESGIREGVAQGLFGLGELENGDPVCRYFKENSPSITLFGSEVIIREDICSTQKEAEEGKEEKSDGVTYPPGGTPAPDIVEGGDDVDQSDSDSSPPESSGRKEIHLQFTVPKGKVAGLMGVMNLLQANFNNLRIDLRATDGEMSEQDYEDKIKEAFAQLDIDLGE